MTPTSRTLAKLRKDGYGLVQVVEKWNPHVKVRIDLFGFGDVLAIRGDEVLLVQTTTGDNAAARLTKMQTLPAVAYWLASPSRRLEIHGWSKRGAVGKRKLWSCRVVDVRMMKQSNGSEVPTGIEI